LLVQFGEQHIALVWTKHPVWLEFESILSQFIIIRLTVLEFSVNEVLTKLMEDPGIKYARHDTVDSDIVSQEHIEAVVHHSEPDLAHGVPTVFKVTLELEDLSEVQDWVFRTKQFERNGGFWHLNNRDVISLSFRISLQLQASFIAYLFHSFRKVTNCTFIGSAVSPITCLGHFLVILNLARIFIFPETGLLYLNIFGDDVDIIECFLICGKSAIFKHKLLKIGC
jgi:hypothetical protein